MKLYGYWRSGAAYRVRIALNLKGVAYQHVGVHLVRDGGEHKQPAYAAINPQARVLRKYDQLEADLQAHQGVLKSLVGLPSVTRDGVEIRICANIGQTADALAAANVKADGAGLYRTECACFV